MPQEFRGCVRYLRISHLLPANAWDKQQCIMEPRQGRTHPHPTHSTVRVQTARRLHGIYKLHEPSDMASTNFHKVAMGHRIPLLQ